MIKIEVTGNSIGEVADKLLAIGGSLQANDKLTFNTKDRYAYDWANAEPDENPSDPIMPEVAEMAPADPTNGGSASPANAAEGPEPHSTEHSAPLATETSEPPAPALNFETDVAPYVLQVVKEKGKPAAQEILSQFGVEKASTLDPAQWPELVEALKGAL